MSKKPKRGFWLDTKNRIFHTIAGEAIQLKRFNPMILERYLSGMEPSIPTQEASTDDAGEKPEPPIVEVDYGKGRKGQEANARDPEYVARMQRWEQQRGINALKIAFRYGVASKPPEDEIAFWKSLEPDMDEHAIKYQYLISLTSNEEEMAAFAQAVMSQEMPTDEGIAQAAESFRSEGEPETDTELELIEGAS